MILGTFAEPADGAQVPKGLRREQPEHVVYGVPVEKGVPPLPVLKMLFMAPMEIFCVLSKLADLIVIFPGVFMRPWKCST